MSRRFIHVGPSLAIMAAMDALQLSGIDAPRRSLQPPSDRKPRPGKNRDKVKSARRQRQKGRRK